MAETRKGHDYGKNMDDDRYGRELHHTRKRDSDNGESYQEIKSKLRNGQISEKDAAREMKNAKFESAEEISDAFRNHLISSSEAQSKARSMSLEHKQAVFSIQRLNEQLKVGKVSAKEGAYQGISLIANNSNGKIKAVTVNRMKNRVIPKYESLAQKRLAQKLRHGGYKMMKLTAGKAIKGTFKGASGLVSMAIPKNIGDHSDPIEGELMDSGSNTLHSGLTRTTSFAGSTFNAIKNRINIHKQKTSRTITQKDLLKSQNARTLRGRKKADEAIAKKISHGSDTRYKLTGTNRFSSVSAKNVAKGVGKGALKAGKEAKNVGASAGRFATNQVSKIATDSLGQTDETVSSIGHASKSAAKLTAKGGKTTAKVAKKTAKATAQATKATVNTTRRVVTTIITAITTVVNTVASAVMSVASMLPVLIPILIAIFIVVLIVIFISTCVSTSPTIIGNMSADFAYYNDVDTFLEAEEKYSEAEQNLYETYRENANLESALDALSKETSQDLNIDNTSFTANTGGSAYHNPYVLAAYLCVKYGPDWTISDVENEWDYSNEDSLIYKQYTIDYSLSQQDEDTGIVYLYNDYETVQNELVYQAYKYIGTPYVWAGKGPTEFDCSGFTSYIYKQATHNNVQLPTDVASVNNQGGTSGQWFWGEEIEKGSSWDDFISRLEVGDLIFMNPNSTQGGYPGHVGIYVGGGVMIDANSDRGAVYEENLRTDRQWDKIVGARRIIEPGSGDWEQTRKEWKVTISFVNNGMNAVITGANGDEPLFTDETDMETYLTMIFYYGAGDENSVSIMEEYWPKDQFQTHSSTITTLDDFLEANGISSDFDIDKTYVATMTGEGYYIDSTGYYWPLDGYFNLSSLATKSGARYNERNQHYGNDIPASEGTPIHATHSGTITFYGYTHDEYKGSSGAWTYGNRVDIQHTNDDSGNGSTVSSRYAHMSRFADGIYVGKEVVAGEVIGYVGTSGNSSGNHLHFEIAIGGARKDSTRWFPDLTLTYDSNVYGRITIQENGERLGYKGSTWYGYSDPE